MTASNVARMNTASIAISAPGSDPAATLRASTRAAVHAARELAAISPASPVPWSDARRRSQRSSSRLLQPHLFLAVRYCSQGDQLRHALHVLHHGGAKVGAEGSPLLAGRLGESSQEKRQEHTAGGECGHVDPRRSAGRTARGRSR